MNQIFRGLSFVTTYRDVVLVHSSNEMEHMDQVVECLTKAGLMLHGRKCHVALSQVKYLGHVSGMSPDKDKVRAGQYVTEVRQFLRLALSIYTPIC